MGRINELFCDYLGRPENVADFWNGTLLRGMPLLQSKCFCRQDREYHKSQHKEGVAGSRRDVLMLYRDAYTFLLGVEVMETLDYSIPVRILDYDAQELMRQVKDVGSAHRQAVEEGLETWENSGEFLYGVKKEDKLFPVHTVALYCGTEEYDGKESVLGMTEHKKRFERMDELAIELMGALIGKNKLKMFKQEKGGVDMCKAFEDEREEGRLEGRLEGEETLRQAISNLMKNLQLSFAQAMEALGIPQSEWEKYQQV